MSHATTAGAGCTLNHKNPNGRPDPAGTSWTRTTHNYPPLHSKAPFIATDNRPPGAQPDGVFRVVVVVSAASEYSRHVPTLVAALTKDPSIAVQILVEKESRFFHQRDVDEAIKQAWNVGGDVEHRWGVRVWTDTDEWDGWTQPGDTVLHREVGSESVRKLTRQLRKWADLVLVAPASADMVAKLASGLSDDVTLSLVRALPESTPVVVCPAMSPDMFNNFFTQYHLRFLRDMLHFVVLGPHDMQKTTPQAPERGAMSDWRDIAIVVQDMAALFQMRQQEKMLEPRGDAEMDEKKDDPKNAGPLEEPPVGSGTWTENYAQLKATPVFPPMWGAGAPMENVIPGLPRLRTEYDRMVDAPIRDAAAMSWRPQYDNHMEAWKSMAGGLYWERKWWIG